LQLAQKCIQSRTKCQGTTSVVPKSPQKKDEGFSPCGTMHPEPHQVSGHAFTPCEKRHPDPHEVSEHDFATCAKMHPEPHEVSGHDFSRAEKVPKKDEGFSPCGTMHPEPHQASEHDFATCAKMHPEPHEVSGAGGPPFLSQKGGCPILPRILRKGGKARTPALPLPTHHRTRVPQVSILRPGIARTQMKQCILTPNA